MTIASDVQKLEPGALVELFELDPTAQGADIARFHGMTYAGPVYWQGNEYLPWPIQAQGFARTSDKPPSPKLAVGNLDGSISALCIYYDDLVGARVIRRRTFAKYLDKDNFPGPELVVNGTLYDFSGWSHSATGVTPGATGAKLQAGAWVSQQVAGVVTGQRYTVTVVVTNSNVASPSGAQLLIGDAAQSAIDLSSNMNTVGIHRMTITAARDNPWVSFKVSEAGKFVQIKSISVTTEGVNPTADPLQEMPPELWFIERKAAESFEAVEFELASPLDFQGVMLPRRQIVANMCSWAYRSADCGYMGPPVATTLDEPTGDPMMDRCGKRLHSCELRFGTDVELPFGGFPAAGLVRT